MQNTILLEIDNIGEIKYIYICGQYNAASFKKKYLSKIYKNLKGRSFRASLCKAAWWATEYYIWIEQNSRIYNDKVRTEEQLVTIGIFIFVTLSFCFGLIV